MRHRLLATAVVATTMACNASGGSLPQPGKCTNPPPTSKNVCELGSQSALPTPRNDARMVTVRGRLYLFGGQTSGSNRFVSEVLIATPEANGGITAWKTAGTALPMPLAAMGVATTDDAIYLFGGEQSDSWGNVDKVWRAAVQDDGELAAWQELAPLPRPLQALAATIVGNHAYVLGGEFKSPSGSSSPESVNTVYVSGLAPDGTLGPWSETRPLPEPRTLLEAFTANGVLYVIGGRSSASFTSCGTHLVIAAKPDATGEIPSWHAATSLPLPLTGFAVAVSGDRVFLAGGVWFPAREQGTLLASTILPSGALNPWEVEGTFGHRYAAAGAAVGNQLYFAGGLVDAHAAQADVLRAQVLDDGRLDCSP